MKRQNITFTVAAFTLCGALLAACGGAGAPAQPADQAANAPAGQANGAPPNGTPGAGGPRGGFGNRKRAAELPADNPVVVGIFIKRNGNTITLRGGGFGGFGQRGPGQGNGNNADATAPTPTPSPPVEFIVDANTKIYTDTTKFDPAAAQSGQQIQQTVQKVDSLDALNMDDRGFITAWGDSSSGKLVATVLVYAERPRRAPGQGQGQPQGQGQGQQGQAQQTSP